MQHFIRKFWQKKRFFNYLLLPFSFIYYGVSLLVRKFSSTKKVDAFIICIGNATVGGSGKTPLAIALAQALISREYKIAFISRGYKAKLSSRSKVVQVDINKYNAYDVGDEPLLLARIAPTYICIDRYLSANKAAKNGAQIIIMDDGLQNYTLTKDLNLLVIDPELGIGNGMLIPAGPLREPFETALNKADYVLINQTSNFALKITKPIFKVGINATNSESFASQSFIALCAIANPERFFATLAKYNVQVIESFVYADHHFFSESAIEHMIELAHIHNCKIITTAKDIVRIKKYYHQWFVIIEIAATLPDLMLEKIIELSNKNKQHID